MRRVVTFLCVVACAKPVAPHVEPRIPPAPPATVATPPQIAVDELAARASRARRNNDAATADRIAVELAAGSKLSFAIPERPLGQPRVSPDGRVWIASNELKPIRIRSAWTGLVLAEIPEIAGRSRNDVVPLDPTHVVTTSLDAVTVLGTDGSIRDLIAPCTKLTEECDGRQYQTLSVAINERRIAVVSDHEVAIYDTAGKKLVATPRESKQERGRRVLWRGATLVIAGARIELWDTAQAPVQLGTIPSTRIWENAFAISDDGQRIALRGRDPVITIYDRAGATVAKFDKAYVSDLAYLGNTLFSFKDSFREVFRIEGDRQIKLAEQIELDGRWAAAGDRIVTADGVLVPTANGVEVIAHVEPAHAIKSLAWSSTGSRLAISAGPGDVVVLDASGAAAVRAEFPVRNSFTFRPTSNELWWIGEGGTVVTWDVGSTGRVAGHQPADARGTSGSLAFDRDGKRMLRQVPDKDLEIVNVADGKVEQSIHAGDDFSLARAVFLDGGRRLLLSDGMSSSLWNANLKVEVWRAREQVHAATSTASLLVLDGGEEARVFDVARQQGATTLRPGYVSRAAFSPDDKTLALGLSTGEVALVEVGSWRTIKTIRAHASGITALAWRPDGASFATGSEGGGLSIWAADGSAIASIAIGTSNVTKRPDPQPNVITIGEVDVGPNWIALFPDGQSYGSELGYRMIAASAKSPLATGIVVPPTAPLERWARLFK